MEFTQEHLERRERVMKWYADWAEVAEYGAKVFRVEF